MDTAGKARRISRKKQAEAFELLITDISAKFANLSSEEVEAAIQDGLRRVVDFLDMDRGALLEITDDIVRVVQAYARPGIPLASSENITRLNWYRSKVRTAEPVIL